MANTKPNSQKQPAGLAGQERDRHEDGDQRQRRGNDSEENFLRAEHGGRTRPHAFIASSHDVLEHHDGVVDGRLPVASTSASKVRMLTEKPAR